MAANQQRSTAERNLPRQEGRLESLQPRIVRHSAEERERSEKRSQVRDKARTLLFLGGFYLVYSSLAGIFAYYEVRFGAGGHPLMTTYLLVAGGAGTALFVAGLAYNRSRI